MARRTTITDRMLKKQKFWQQGQTALVVVLVSIVLLTLGIAAARQSTIDIRTTLQTEETVQALAAAEAGLQLGLLHRSSGSWQLTPTPPNIASAEYVVTHIPSDISYAIESISAGKVSTVWLTDDPSDPPSGVPYIGNVALEWDPDSADVEIMVLYQDGTDIKIDRQYITSSDTVSMDSGDSPYDNEWVLIRVKPITEDLTTLRVSNYNLSAFPSQGITVESTGQTGSGITRRLLATQMNEEIPYIFDYALFSGSSIIK
jgi:hypothetical protein